MSGRSLTRLARMAAFALAASLCTSSPLSAQEETVVYRDAAVWTGSGFATRDLAMRGGRFIEPATAGTDARIVEAAGRFALPAYANAHVHLTPATPAGSQSFTDVGVFYALNPNSVVMPRERLAFFARPDSYDVSVSMGSVTVPGGHPERLYVDILGPRVYPGRTRESFVGDAFHYGETHAQIDAVLDLLARQGAEFVKAMLYHAEEPRRQGDPAFYGRRGLTPDNFRYLVEAARRRGLTTVAHVESAADLVLAAEAGARMAMHLPGYWIDEKDEPRTKRLTNAQARRIARSGIAVVPTYGLTQAYGAFMPAEVHAATVPRVRPTQAANLRLLRRHGVTILIGTDDSAAIFGEVDYLAGLDVFTPAELLRIVLETGRHIFPDRRIGCFEPGCEADFLLLRKNPLSDLAALQSIESRVKNGLVLGSTPTPPAQRSTTSKVP